MPDNDAQGSLTNFSMAATPATNAPTNLPNGPGLAAMTTEEREHPIPAVQNWTTEYAAKIAMGDFKKMEAYRTINHDWRFRVSDQLYLAWKERKTWEGTKIPRSSLGIFIALEQIEAMLPSAILNLFPDNNRLPFDIEPEPGTTIEQAEAVRDLLQWQMGDVGDPGKYLTIREIARRAYKSSYTYGHGPIEFGVLDKMIVRTHFERQQIPVRQMIPHPLTGEPVGVPTGEMRSSVNKTIQTQHVVRPMLQSTDVRDFYWDPNCTTPNVNDGSCCAVRNYRTVNQLLEYDGVEGFSIPSPEALLKLAQIKTMSQGDTTKANQESFRGMTYQPNLDYSIDPANAQVEVIRYWQKGRHVWMLGRQWVGYNRRNDYGMPPLLNASYVDVPGRFA